MKKFLALAVITVLVMMPLVSFAKTAISDSDLDSVTAQSGVSIDFNNLSVSGVTLNTQSWGDTDGASGYPGAGYVGMTGINLIGNTVVLNGTMNIDSGTISTTSGNVTKLKIDLPTITMGGSGANGMNITFTVKVDSTKTLDGPNASTLGYVNIQGLSVWATGGITVFAH